MDDQGGAGGVPLHGDDEASRRRAPHVKPRAGKTGAGDGTTRAADTDEASRLDRPAGPTAPGERPDRWKGPEE
jgi:hypothetical protein